MGSLKNAVLFLFFFLSALCYPTMVNGTEKNNFQIESNPFLHLYYPNPDSTLLVVQGDSIESWSVERQGVHGIAHMRVINAQEAYLIYTPGNRQHVLDTIVVEAARSDGTSAEKAIIATLYDNKYQYYGEMLLDMIRHDFYNGQFSLYAESIDSNRQIQQSISYIWPASHLLRAFKTAYRLNGEKYLRPLRSYCISLDGYLSTASGKVGYAAYPGEQGRFFDDNGLFAIQFAEIFPLLNDKRILDRAIIAYSFNNNDRDNHWGLPQHENELGQGMFYSMAVNQTGLGAALLYQLTGEQDYLTEAENYFLQMNNPEVLLRDPSHHLFHQYTFFQNGKWSLSGVLNGQLANGSGFRAYQTTHVAQLAFELFRITRKQQYLDEGLFLVDRCISFWVQSSGAMNENSFWGGNDMIDVLIDAYNISGEDHYLEVAKGIIDYLTTYGRDAFGYYPSDYDDRYGKWNLDRRDIYPSSILMMGQAAAASGILRVAKAVEQGPTLNAPGNQNRASNKGFKIYPTVMKAGASFHLENQNFNSETIYVRIYSLDGRLHQEHILHSNGFGLSVKIPGINGSPGLYVISITTPTENFSEKIIIK